MEASRCILCDKYKDKEKSTDGTDVCMCPNAITCEQCKEDETNNKHAEWSKYTK